jgi:hypothetical protein
VYGFTLASSKFSVCWVLAMKGKTRIAIKIAKSTNDFLKSRLPCRVDKAGMRQLILPKLTLG